MILNTGSRTDIPAFYAEWFVRRLREGFVMARSPYDPQRITRYVLDPAVVDLIVFCTKNPAPLLAYRDALASFRQFWGVTITPYGKDVEPETPPVEAAIASLAALSRIVGRRAVGAMIPYSSQRSTRSTFTDRRFAAWQRNCRERQRTVS